MYQEFFGLRELAFELTPNPRFLFMTPRHLEALSNLEYGLSSGKGLTVLIGEAGTGKTTLLHAAFESDRCRGVQCVYINNPSLTRDEFIQTLAMRFELSPEAGQSKAVLLEELEEWLIARRANGEIAALVMDEAQSLSVELLEEVRLLANIETTTTKLLPVVLVGQPALAEKLERFELQQLKQRVALRCEISPLELTETAALIAHRIKTAGGTPSRVFTRDAVAVIHEYSGGIPRTISVICDNALITGLALRKQPIDRHIVLEVCRDFWLRERTEATLLSREAESEDDSRDGVERGASTSGLLSGAGEDEKGRARPKRYSLFGARRS
jgi:general secretion pathway protein A